MMRYTLYLYLLFLLIILINCDADSISSSYSRPEVRLVVIEDESTLDGASIGDSVTIALGLDVKNMSDIFSLGFKVSFDDEIIKPKYKDLSINNESCDGSCSNNQLDDSQEECEADFGCGDLGDEQCEWVQSSLDGCGTYNNEDLQNSYNFYIDGSFFETSGEPVYDENGNGILDDGEQYSDQNGNGQYDSPIEYPVGNIMFGDQNQNNLLDYIEGNLGVPDPDTNGNVWGAGRICAFYFEGILTETVFDINITNAVTYVGGDNQIENYPTSSWDIYTLLVGSPHNPVLLLDEGEITPSGMMSIILKVEDSPKLSSFTAKIEYDSNVISYLGEDPLNFFNQSYYDVDTDIYYDTQLDKGYYVIYYDHHILQGAADLVEQPLAEGWGDIVELTFQINSGIADTSTTIRLINNTSFPSVYGWNPNMGDNGEPYELDKGYWTVQESLEINF